VNIRDKRPYSRIATLHCVIVKKPRFVGAISGRASTKDGRRIERRAESKKEELSVQTYTAYTNVFDDGKGRRYPSGIIFETAQAAVEAQRKPTVGTAVFVAQITWSEPDTPISEWTKGR
jgi:hypothetical protein